MYHFMPVVNRIAKFSVLVVAIAALLFISSNIEAKKPVPPPPPECDGSPITLINGGGDGCEASMTISVTDSSSVCDILCLYNSSKKTIFDCPVVFVSWIGGVVIADASAANGFRFDPATVLIAEVTAEGMQTNICQISANPTLYAGSRWYIPYDVQSVQ
ncbi:MAG: hypothetical protein R3F48_06135 [Candidatus Zixiibacteriota bacterium]